MSWADLTVWGLCGGAMLGQAAAAVLLGGQVLRHSNAPDRSRRLLRLWMPASWVAAALGLAAVAVISAAARARGEPPLGGVTPSLLLLFATACGLAGPLALALEAMRLVERHRLGGEVTTAGWLATRALLLLLLAAASALVVIFAGLVISNPV